MAHFAELDADDRVIYVVVVNNEDCRDVSGAESEATGAAFLHAVLGPGRRWVQTSYSGSIRKNYAGLGYAYDAARDAFIPPQPGPDWTLDEATCRWVAPAAPAEE